MLTYTYVARDPKTGKKVSSDLEASNEKGASKLLTDKGLVPIDITLKSQKGGGFLKNRVSTKQKVIFSRQVSTMINAGLPIIQSLNSVRDQTANKTMQGIIDNVISDVEGGSSLADALSRHPKYFDNVYINLVAAGETSGTLDKSLERLANQQEKDAEIMSKVRGAMIYPAIVIFVLIAFLVFMTVAVLPQVESIYKEIPNVKLPFLTRALLALSHFVTHYWWLTILIVVGIGVFMGKWSRTPKGREIIDDQKTKMWPVGPLYRKLYMARFARTGSTLIASGVPMIQMLQVTAKAVDNVKIEQAILKATEKVRGGKSLADSLKGDPYFLTLVPNMLGIGEQSGSVESMLEKVADYYEKEVDNEIKAISTIIEPVLIIVIGIVALLMVAAILLPIYGLAGKKLV